MDNLTLPILYINFAVCKLIFCCGLSVFSQENKSESKCFLEMDKILCITHPELEIGLKLLIPLPSYPASFKDNPSNLFVESKTFQVLSLG